MLSIFKKRKLSSPEPGNSVMPDAAANENAAPSDSAAGSDPLPEPAAVDSAPSPADAPDASAEAEGAALSEPAPALPAEELPADASAHGCSEENFGMLFSEEKPGMPGDADAAVSEPSAGAAPDDGSPAESLAMPETVVPPVPAGPADRIFNALSHAAPVVLLLFAAAAAGLTVWLGKGLHFPDAGRIADAVMSVSSDSWLTVNAHGTPCPDIPPLFIWFAAAIALIPGIPSGTAPLLASAVSYGAFIVSVWGLAAAAGFGRRTAFASGLAVLCCLPLAALFSIMGPELLSASLCTAGMAFLFRGWTKKSAPLLLGAGFILLGLSAMAGGPAGIPLAVLSSIAFLFWRGTPGRLNGRDGIPGFLLMLLMISAWLSALYLGGHEDYLRSMLDSCLLPRIIGPAPDTAEWYLYLAAGPFLLLPWTILPLFADWPAAIRGIPSAWRNRRSNGGSAWLWIWAFCGVAILSCIQSRHLPMLLPAAAPLAVLAGRTAMKLSNARSRCFFGFTAALYALAGLALVLAESYPPLRALIPADIIPAGILPELPPEIAEWLPRLGGIMYTGALLVILAVALLFFTRLALPGGALLITAFFLAAAAAPWQYLTLPSLNAAFESSAPPAAPLPDAGTPAGSPGVRNGSPDRTDTPEAPAPAAATL